MRLLIAMTIYIILSHLDIELTDTQILLFTIGTVWSAAQDVKELLRN